MTDRLKGLKTHLLGVVEGQMTHLDSVDTKELGEAIDMIKDLEEAVYYCTITEAMEKEENHKKDISYYWPIYRDIDRQEGRMYYQERDSQGRFTESNSNGGRRNYGGNGNQIAYFTERDMNLDWRDRREGRSGASRKTYMEAKEMQKDKSHKMRELENYMHELSEDIVEMIQGASPEEKQILEKKLSTLASKVAN